MTVPLQRSRLLLVTEWFLILLSSNDTARLDAYPPVALYNFIPPPITIFQIHNIFPMIMKNTSQLITSAYQKPSYLNVQVAYFQEDGVAKHSLCKVLNYIDIE